MTWTAALRPRPTEPPPPGPDGKPPEGPPPLTWTLAAGISGVLLASLLSNVNTRSTTFALVDLRGGMGYGMDESAWVSEAYNVGSVAILPLTPWLAGIISARRGLAAAVALQTLAALSVPLATSYSVLIALRFAQGVGGGALIPLLLLTLLRLLPSYQRIWGFAVYAVITTVPPLISETIAGALSEYLGWQAIFLQNLLPGPIAMLLVLAGLPLEKPKLEAFGSADYFGMICAVLFVSTITAALDQGQRLDWFSSRLIVGLFMAAATSLAVFVWHSLATPVPLINLRLFATLNFSCGLVSMFAFSFASLGTALLLPQFGAQVQGFRELQVGNILIVVAVSQVVLCPVAAALLRILDARILLALGFGLATCGNWMATYITADWVRGNFLLPLTVMACGSAFIMVPLILISTSVLEPKDGSSGSALFNIVRSLAATFGVAIVGAVVTVRERVHSGVIAERIVAGAPATMAQEAEGGLTALAAKVTRQAYVMAYADAYGWLGVATFSALLIVLILRETRLSFPPTLPRPVPGPAGAKPRAATA